MLYDDNNNTLTWQIGPFDVRCGLFSLKQNSLGLLLPDPETILLQEERDMIKEED